MNTYTIKATEDLFNIGQCFTKDRTYTVVTGRNITTEASLMECQTINDLGEKHLIGSWWRKFKIVKPGK
jgi:hypothetical protein